MKKKKVKPSERNYIQVTNRRIRRLTEKYDSVKVGLYDGHRLANVEVIVNGSVVYPIISYNPLLPVAGVSDREYVFNRVGGRKNPCRKALFYEASLKAIGITAKPIILLGKGSRIINMSDSLIIARTMDEILCVLGQKENSDELKSRLMSISDEDVKAMTRVKVRQLDKDLFDYAFGGNF